MHSTIPAEIEDWLFTTRTRIDRNIAIDECSFMYNKRLYYAVIFL